jgi:uncharacterized protein YndB with AHSA1/START domain
VQLEVALPRTLCNHVLHDDGKEALMVADRIERDVLIDAPVEVVWDVVTQPDHIAGWFGDKAELDLRPGGDAAFTWTEHGMTAQARVERVEPPTAFSFRWGLGNAEAPTSGLSTLVEFVLAAEGAGTRLRVVESGFAQLDATEEERAAYYDDHADGWRQELGELVDHAVRVAGRATGT